MASHVGDAPLAVAANRGILAEALGLPSDRLVFPGLVHSTDVGVVESPIGHFPNVDVLVTSTRKIGLVTMGADCVPLIAADPEAGVALVAHVGWRGAADGIVQTIFATLANAGGSLKRTQFILGPSICGNCYLVDEQRRELVVSVLPGSGQKNSQGLDLREGIAAELRSANASVKSVGGCTAEDPQLFSHRRDGVTGRQAAAVVLA
jgi:hypothetical protein